MSEQKPLFEPDPFSPGPTAGVISSDVTIEFTADFGDGRGEVLLKVPYATMLPGGENVAFEACVLRIWREYQSVWGRKQVWG